MLATSTKINRILLNFTQIIMELWAEPAALQESKNRFLNPTKNQIFNFNFGLEKSNFWIPNIMISLISNPRSRQ